MSESAVVVFSEEKRRLIQATVAQDASPAELELFLEQCVRTGLDPVIRQIHFVKRQGKGVYQVGIDGYRLIADRTGRYAGNDEPVYDSEDASHPNKATVTVWKVVGEQRCAFTASARWKEYCPPKGLDWMWIKMPYLMLAKCAEALALRKAFPQELSGLYTHEEMQQADEPLLGGDTPENGQETEHDASAEVLAMPPRPMALSPLLDDPEAEYRPLSEDQLTQLFDLIKERTGSAPSEVSFVVGQPLARYLVAQQLTGREFLRRWRAWKQQGTPIPGAAPALWRESAAAPPSDEEAVAAHDDGE